ncbi:uncharacterized protein CLUP02_02287 [Colletotrichum lupini]|uniref:Secreted protein n=1 Tax=Colletotrichum lupini TaxID=145971 RepID=A0A9Q8SDY5_9PEZI|nr:uncharacterized protein CLUP02_02287 [Colletotrichum lupini]UQC75631.1 hypothetical protein CLUP02_02287 [Colletotrichum lupini]
MFDVYHLQRCMNCLLGILSLRALSMLLPAAKRNPSQPLILSTLLLERIPTWELEPGEYHGDRTIGSRRIFWRAPLRIDCQGDRSDAAITKNGGKDSHGCMALGPRHPALSRVMPSNTDSVTQSRSGLRLGLLGALRCSLALPTTAYLVVDGALILDACRSGSPDETRGVYVHAAHEHFTSPLDS